MKDFANKSQPSPPETKPTETARLNAKNLFPMTIQITEHPTGEPTSWWGNALLGKRARLKLEIDDHATPIQLDIEDRLVIGRAHPHAPEKPDLDLTPYDAEDKGVSRMHVMLIKEENALKAEDLDSTNGTFLNGIRLYPHQPRIIRNGDTLILGQLALKITSLT
jgi:hypothetical protein